MIRLNGQECDLSAGQTVADALRSLGLEADAKGVAVAVDGEVVRRADWHSQALGEDAQVEVLAAMQGG